MKSVGMDRLRETLQSLTKTGKGVSNQLLYQALQLEDEESKARLRRRLNELVKRGELRRIMPGVYEYDHAAAPKPPIAESYVRLWRVIRTSKPGWTLQDVILVAGIDQRQAREYVRWLASEEVGLVARAGRDGNSWLWRTTMKGLDQRETPYPQRLRDPWESERDAACRLVRCYMEANPDAPRVRRRISEAARLILASVEDIQTETEEAV